MGASTDHFLLEKSRLVKVDRGERGYHIFYQVLVAASGCSPSPHPRIELDRTEVD